ncbi:hypothetical protein NQ317_005957 [Molorchus minor]|uniref:Tyr recombinase domain-containing protein n=1 Tax=Molorchus minor TaxID=1323400 RepID=A0ABQ9JJI2_9CUCU|nr:hypothetical protein NQ317_005957 [Molorchus minor]
MGSVNQPVGKNTFDAINYAQLLNLADVNLNIGHCFRRSSATLLVDSEEDILNLKRHGEWKSSTVAEIYVLESNKNKLDVKKILYKKNPVPLKKLKRRNF